jgi:ABC-type nitrate/sulfonate/bicarbonate transport system substrate-binding protein
MTYGKGASNTMSNRTRLLPGFLAASLILVACSSAATPAPTTPAVASRAPTSAPTKTTDGTLPKPELAKLKIAATIAEAGQFATMMAQRLGIYEKYGIHAQVIIFNDDGAVLQAMLSGQTDIAQVGVAGTISSQTTDTPAKTVAVQKTRVVDALYCSKDIKTAADVKGKTIGISSLGSTAHASGLLALQALKLTDKDVTFTTVGGESARVAALKGGSIACAPASFSQKDALTALGFNMVVDLSTSNLQYPATAVAMPTAFLQKNPNTALILVASILESLNLMLKDTQSAAVLYAAFAQIDVAKALPLVQALPATYNPSMKWTKEGFLFAQSVMAIVNPSITSVDVTKAYDMSLLQTLEDIGFYKKIGAPTT